MKKYLSAAAAVFTLTVSSLAIAQVGQSSRSAVVDGDAAHRRLWADYAKIKKRS